MITLFGKSKKQKEKGKQLKTKKPTEKKEIKAIKKKIPTGKSDIAWKVLKSPLISEKATFFEEQGKYIFKVSKKANKTLVKKAIEDIYNVKISKINIVNTKRKKRKLGRIEGFKPGYKKAIVSLKGEDKIEIVPR